MAKTTGTVVATEHKIEEFAEDRKMLGQARSKAEGCGPAPAVVGLTNFAMSDRFWQIWVMKPQSPGP
jgi:hypothetical protein